MQKPKEKDTSKEASKIDEKKSVSKKTFLDKCANEINTAVDEAKKLKSSVEKSVANSKEGLGTAYPLTNALLITRRKIMEQAKADGTNNLKDFMETNWTAIKQKKFVFDKMGYPSEKDEQGKFKRDLTFENLFVRANKLSNLFEYNGENGFANKNCGLTIKGSQFYVVSNKLYPDLPVADNKSEIKFVKNNSTDLIKLTTRGLEILWASCRPVVVRNPKPDNENITKTLKEIKDWLNGHWLKRVKNVNYLDEKFTNTDVKNLALISEFSLRIIEQQKIDRENITEDGNINELKVIKGLEKVSYQVRDENNKLIKSVAN